MTPARPARPLGISLLSAFFLFGMCASGLAAALLLWPGSTLDQVWRVNPHGHAGLTSLGPWALLLLGVASLACGTAAVGLFQGRRWGQRLAVVLLTINLISDLLNAGLGVEPWAAIGVPVVAALFWYLSSAKVRAYFAPTRDKSGST